MDIIYTVVRRKYVSMKIHFFKNESHFYPRLSYSFENAKIVPYVDRCKKVRNLLPWFLLILSYVFYILFRRQLPFMFYSWILPLHIPVHELCHALFCWLCGRKVARICFFPNKFRLTGAGAYVKPSFGVFSKYQTILLFAFPFLLLTVLPAILAVFIPTWREELLLLSLINLAGSTWDMMNVYNMFFLPKNGLYFGDFAVTVTDETKPVIIHKLYVTNDMDRIHHKRFTYENGKFTENDSVYDTPDTILLKKEFMEQFNLEG